MQLVFRYGFLKHQDIWLSLSDVQYGLLVLATILIAAGGYVINDIFDQGTDSKNKPNNVVVGNSVSESTAYYIYAGLTLAGVAIGMYLSNVIEKPGFISIFIFIAALLYYYASTLKPMLLIGNVVVAAVLAFSVLVIGFFDIFPATHDGNAARMTLVFSVLKDYAIFAFIINFIREIVKDLEDVNGDYNQGMSTLPIVLGIGRTAYVVFGLLFVPLFLLSRYLYQHIMNNNLYYTAVYAMVFVIAPLLFCIIRMYTASTKKDFHQVSVILKCILFFGILSLIVLTQNIIYNVAQ